MKKYVIDTSVITKYFIGDDDRNKVKHLLSIAIKGGIKLYAPQLIWYEFYSVMVQSYGTTSEAMESVSDFHKIIKNNTIELIANTDAIEKAIEVAFSKATGKKGYISPYDAYFHGTALLLGCPFLTNDEKHYNKTKDSFGNVILFKDLELPSLT